jgi:polygalacturonase
MTGADFLITLPEFPDKKVSIKDFGAVENQTDIAGSKRNAAAINSAMSVISNEGGGTVVIPKGIWITGPIRLQSNVCLYLERGAVVKFSKNIEEYPLILTNYEGQECIRTVSPVTADHAENIAICGDGVIDGSGDLWRPVKQFKMTGRQWAELMKKNSNVLDTKEGGIWFPTESAFLGNEKNIQKDEKDALKKAEQHYDFYRPVMVSLEYCDRVLLEGVTFMNSPAWNIHPFFCTNLTVKDAVIRNPYYAQNGDGIDVESCNGVEIYNCTFETGDDAICIKSGKNAEARTFEGPCENVYIHDCLVNEGHGGFVVGSEMSRGVKHVLVENCTFLGTDVGVRFKSAMGRGGVVEDIEVSHIQMTGIKHEAVILTMSYVLNLLNREQGAEGFSEDDIPYFKNITMHDINCMGAETAVKIEPMQGKPETISDITIRDSWFEAEKENVIDGVNIHIEA